MFLPLSILGFQSLFQLNPSPLDSSSWQLFNTNFLHLPSETIVDELTIDNVVKSLDRHMIYCLVSLCKTRHTIVARTLRSYQDLLFSKTS